MDTENMEGLYPANITYVDVLGEKTGLKTELETTIKDRSVWKAIK